MKLNWIEIKMRKALCLLCFLVPRWIAVHLGSLLVSSFKILLPLVFFLAAVSLKIVKIRLESWKNMPSEVKKCHFGGLQQKKSMMLSEGCSSTLMYSIFWYIALVNTRRDQEVMPKIKSWAPHSKLKNRHFLDYGQACPGQSITGL